MNIFGHLILISIMLGVIICQVADLILDSKYGVRCYTCKERKKELKGLHMEDCRECSKKSKEIERTYYRDLLNLK